MIYISTCALSGIQNIEQAVIEAIQNGYRNIELSTCHDVQSLDPLIDLYQKEKLNILIHNYFPPPKESFLLNLASSDPIELELSQEHVKSSLKLSRQFKAPFYTVHAGFRGSGKVTSQGIHFTDKIESYEKSFEILLDSIDYLQPYAKKEKVLMVLENNTPSNIARGNVKDFVLLSHPNEFQRLTDTYKSDDLGLLLDVGHLKVASKILNFDLGQGIEKFKSHLVGMHIHDNDGTSDSHQNISEKSWFLPKLKNISKELDRPIALTIESKKLTFAEIKTAVSILQENYLS
jgi:sugar phosphate isomerase/epimerase